MTATTRPRILILEPGFPTAAHAVKRQGGDAVTVNPRDLDAVEKALGESWDGLLLTGGGDVDPRLYDEKPHRKVYGVSELRDFTEWLALDCAKDAGIPVLGICRGSQLMAVHNGGRLKQHIAGHRGIDHFVFSQTGSLFKAIVGQSGRFVSLHHQVVLRTGNGWRVAGRDGRGNIEAIESRDGRCLGVQFHPEMDHERNEESRRIFRWLVVAAADRAGLPKPKRRGRKPVKMTPVPKQRKRKAGQPTLPSELRATRSRKAPVKVSWLCPTCGLRFDKSEDREDHIYWIHGDPKIKTTEPPPGHPDWISPEEFEDMVKADLDWTEGSDDAD